MVERVPKYGEVGVFSEIWLFPPLKFVCFQKFYLFIDFLCITFQLHEGVGRIRSERKQLEQDYQQLYNKKEAIIQWESQVDEVIKWFESSDFNILTI